MAERLTEKDSIDNKRYMLNSEENTVCTTNARLNNCSTIAYCWGKPIDKLAQLEDIMEKYGVESLEELDNALKYAKVIGEILCKYGINDNENLEWFLDDYSKNQGRDFAICEERDTLRQERDTWQKACELACEREDDCYVYDNIHRAYEFYQQAKKEKQL